MNRSVLVVIVVIAILFGVFVWPTRYRYDHLPRGWLIRIDRFTSRVEILRNGGWECYAGCPRNTTYDDLLTPAMPASTPTSPAVSPPTSSLSPVSSRLDLVPISGYTSRLIAVGAASGFFNLADPRWIDTKGYSVPVPREEVASRLQAAQGFLPTRWQPSDGPITRSMWNALFTTP